MDKTRMTSRILSCITRWIIVSFNGVRNTKRGPGRGEKTESLILDVVSKIPVGCPNGDTQWSIRYVDLEVRGNACTGNTDLGISNI